MRYRDFGASDRPVSVVGQGTWNLDTDSDAASEALGRGLDVGMTHVDTAESYSNVRVEEIVGRALKGRRHEAFLVSKVLPKNATRRGTVESCEASLRRLQTDYLDCLLLHWIGPHPFVDTIAGFEELRSRGLIRAWGVSNFQEMKLTEMLRIAPPGSVSCNQVLYHLEERSIEHAVIPYCAARGISVVGYSAFGSGRFPSTRGGPGVVLAEIAASRGATPRQVALAFLLRRIPFVLVKSSKRAHVEENAAAADIELTDGEADEIQTAFPRGPRRLGVPTL